MLDLIKKGIYLGIGAASVTKEKVEALIDELIEKGQLKQDEKSHTMQEILDRLEQEEQKLTGKIKQTVEKVISETGIPTQKDLEEIKQKLSKLEKMIGK
jgi:polyhydroxyalkanoate synthesis regulator phasin